MIKRGEPVSLVKSRILSLAAPHSKPDEPVRYEFRWRVIGPDPRVLCREEDSFLRFKLIATHSRSGATKVFTHDFTGDAFVEGVHPLGVSLDVRSEGIPA